MHFELLKIENDGWCQWCINCWGCRQKHCHGTDDDDIKFTSFQHLHHFTVVLWLHFILYFGFCAFCFKLLFYTVLIFVTAYTFVISLRIGLFCTKQLILLYRIINLLQSNIKSVISVSSQTVRAVRRFTGFQWWVIIDLSDITLFYINSFHHPNTLVIISVPVDMALPSLLYRLSSCAKTSWTACSVVIYINFIQSSRYLVYIVFVLSILYAYIVYFASDKVLLKNFASTTSTITTTTTTTKTLCSIYASISKRMNDLDTRPAESHSCSSATRDYAVDSGTWWLYCRCTDNNGDTALRSEMHSVTSWG